MWVRVMVFKVTFNNISVISWQLVLLVDEKMNKRFHNMTQYGMLLDGSVSLKIQLIKDTTYN
jgi:hypothetical protein